MCTEQGSPPNGFPSCVWAIPATGGEVLLDTVGSTSEAEVRQAIAERRAPKLAPHSVTQAESARAVDAVQRSTFEFTGVLDSHLPDYTPPGGTEPVTVMVGQFETDVGGIHITIYVHHNGGVTIVYEFSNGGGLIYDSEHGWFTLM
ncbi:hypothetical protein [Citreicoccus inhibens]|uniref:hypothetical protein n=1 Tax=Citreicoccus inhibens TaxID=2849499 RepID=UPI001F3B9E22|nr:hypothetical protein [Citreicoccus inhibens]